jgi:hypothetical protein
MRKSDDLSFSFEKPVKYYLFRNYHALFNKSLSTYLKELGKANEHIL